MIQYIIEMFIISYLWASHPLNPYTLHVQTLATAERLINFICSRLFGRSHVWSIIVWIKQIETNIQHLEINCLTWFLLFGWLCFSWSLTSLWSLFSIRCSSICLAWCWCALWGRCLLSVATNNYILLSCPLRLSANLQNLQCQAYHWGWVRL